MKVYGAIGHWKKSENITSIAEHQQSKAAFITDCHGNAFVPYIVITEPMLKKLLDENSALTLFEQVTRMTTNYRVWNIVCDYIEQCGYILEEKFNAAKQEG